MRTHFSTDFLNRRLIGGVLSALCLLAAPPAFTQGAQTAPARTSFEGPLYSAVLPVEPQQAQVVFFRKPGPLQSNSAAHVYVNGEFHTALPPQAFTRICLPPGSHALEAYIGDAPRFEGKERPRTLANLEGGRTYFLAVSEQGAGEPVPVVRAEAEAQLAGAFEQRRFVSRASAVQACQNLAPVKAEPEKQRYTFSADVLFAFAKSDYASITPEGREALRKVAQQLRDYSPSTVNRVTVRGHADPIGSVESNRVLSEQRARTVSRVLAEEGLAPELMRVEGVGSAEPVVSCATRGPKAQRVACNAPNRRVELVAEGVR